jgi:hypothetical protein
MMKTAMTMRYPLNGNQTQITQMTLKPKARGIRGLR